MPSWSATRRAWSVSRDAMATTSQRSAFWIPGMTFSLAMWAVDRIPQRSLFMGRLPPRRLGHRAERHLEDPVVARAREHGEDRLRGPRGGRASRGALARPEGGADGPPRAAAPLRVSHNHPGSPPNGVWKGA